MNFKIKMALNNMGSHNVRTHWMHHVHIQGIDLKMVHWNRNMLPTMYLQAPCVLYIAQAFRYSPDNAFYIYLINKYISLSDIFMTVRHWYK